MLIAALVLLPTLVLASGFSIGPPSIELEVPSGGSAVVTFYVTSDFDGELQVSLENIPLKVEPTTIPIGRTDNNREVELTFYGDESLGSQVYDGKVRFLALTGGNVATGIKIKARIINLVEEQTVAVSTGPPEESEEATPAGSTSAPSTSPSSSGFAWYIYVLIGLVIAIVATVVVAVRRR